MAVIHNAKHHFNNGVTNVPSWSILSDYDNFDPRQWTGFYEDFSQWDILSRVMTAAALVHLKSGRWINVMATDNDLIVTSVEGTQGSPAMLMTSDGGADDGGFTMKDGAHYYLTAG